MFSYEFYKVIHLFSIILFAGVLGLSFAPSPTPKWAKILMGATGVLIFIAGMGLLARIGGGWPSWVLIKMLLWVVLMVAAPLLSKCLQGIVAKRRALLGLWALMGLAVYFGIYHLSPQ